MKIIRYKLVPISNALQALSSFKLSGKTFYKIAKILQVVRPECDTILEVREALAKKIPQDASVQAEWLAFINEPVELDLKTLLIKELDLENNSIPASTLEPLLEILDGNLPD